MVQRLRQQRRRRFLPRPLKGIDRDNGGEFINAAMKTGCERREITFTRTRSFHKNDNGYGEQKNGDVVRKTVGYARYTNEGILAAVYSVLNPLLNYFYHCPSSLIQYGMLRERRGRSMTNPPRRMNGFWTGRVCRRK